MHISQIAINKAIKMTNISCCSKQLCLRLKSNQSYLAVTTNKHI